MKGWASAELQCAIAELPVDESGSKQITLHTVHPFNLQFCAEVMQEKFMGIQVILS